MTSDYDSEVRVLARTLSDIAHALDSADQADARILRVLALTQRMVPYDTCALLEAIPGAPAEVFALPAPTAAERAELSSELTRVLDLVRHAEEIGSSTDGPRCLTLPLMGLDEIIGVIRVVPSDELTYDARHLRLLSVVAAQLGAYLTMIKLRQDEARRADELAAAHDFQQRLMGIVSHDLGNPLSVVTMVASTMLRETTDPRKEKALRHVLRSAERASRIINDLLDVTRIRVSGDMMVAPKPTKLRGLLQELVDELRVAHPGREIQFSSAAGAEVVGQWDSDRLAQMVTNLVNNAVRHGDERAAVRVELAFSGGRASISVANDGPKIPAEILPTIFDPFKRGRGAKRVAGGGLGLGLYIVAQIARAHGGDIRVRSTDSEGTVFTIELPIAGRGEREASDGSRAGAEGERQQAARSERVVMVVDDDSEVRAGMADLLRSEGYDVVAASNGGEALAMLRGGTRPCLILLDLGMPVMDGETFAAMCKEDPDLAEIPIVIISADTATAVKLTLSGIPRFLEKPVSAEQLLHTVEEIGA